MSETYESIPRPYDDALNREGDNFNAASQSGVSQEGESEEEQDTGIKSLNDLWISSWIKSRNFQPKTQGFLIEGRTGYIECMKLYVGSGGIVGGKIDIPDETTDNSFHVDALGNMWIGANVADGYTLADAYVLNTGEAHFRKITLDTDVSIDSADITLGTLTGTTIFVWGDALRLMDSTGTHQVGYLYGGNETELRLIAADTIEGGGNIDLTIDASSTHVIMQATNFEPLVDNLQFLGQSDKAWKTGYMYSLSLTPLDSPPTGDRGDIYYDTDDKIYFYDGDSWEQIGSANIIYGTGSPPDASGYSEGTLFVRYIA